MIHVSPRFTPSSSLLPSLFCTFPSLQHLPGSLHFPFICLFLSQQQSCLPVWQLRPSSSSSFSSKFRASTRPAVSTDMSVFILKCEVRAKDVQRQGLAVRCNWAAVFFSVAVFVPALQQAEAKDKRKTHLGPVIMNYAARPDRSDSSADAFVQTGLLTLAEIRKRFTVNLTEDLNRR